MVRCPGGSRTHRLVVTPISDRLTSFIGDDVLATYSRRRHAGGEWDSLAAAPLRLRRRLAGAGMLRRDGMKPDVFCDMLRRYVGSECEPDPIAWYLREATRAIRERRTAVDREARLRLARRNGLHSYYEWRLVQAIEAGYDSFWEYRKSRWP